MSDWKSKSKISGDVVFFEYVSSELAKNASFVFVWDLDKTYLDTHFESIRGLYRTIIEKAFQKKNVPGTSSLVRAITSSRSGSAFPIYFITASPPQMEEKIREKLEIDGIFPYGIFFKDNLKNLRPGRFTRLGQQVGYKLQALMQLRQVIGESAKQILWGDDSESDAVIYSLYSDVCARRLEDEQLDFVLENLKVRGKQLKLIKSLQSQTPANDPTERIYINLATDTDPDYYFKFGRRTLPTYNTFQVALDLYQLDHLALDQLAAVGQDMVTNYGFSVDELFSSLNDLVCRKVLYEEKLTDVFESLIKERLVPENFKLIEPAITRELYDKLYHSDSSTDSEQWIPSFVDYLNDFR